MMKNIRPDKFGLWLFLIATLFAAGCGQASGERHRPSTGDGFPREIDLPDASSVTIEQRPERVVSLSVGTDEILCALVGEEGLHRIAALSGYSTEPEISNVSQIAREVGVLVTRDTERVVSLRPDLVLAARYTKPEMRRLVAQASVPMIVVSDFRSLSDIESNIRLIGRALGEEARANNVVDGIHAKLREARSRLNPKRFSLRVLYLAPGNWTAGAMTNVHEMVTAAGLRDAAAEAGVNGHTKISAEKVIEINPDLIIIAAGHARDRGFRSYLASDPQLAALTAVKNNRIVELPSRYLRAVSHYLADGALALVDAVNSLFIESS